MRMVKKILLKVTKDLINLQIAKDYIFIQIHFQGGIKLAVIDLDTISSC